MPTPKNTLLGIVLVTAAPVTPSATAEANDALLCPVLASLTPGIPGVIDIYADGDVTLAGEPFWDCPPYT